MPKLSAKNRPKRPDAAANARPRKIIVLHGGSSVLAHGGVPDGRTRPAKAEKKTYDALVNDLGRQPTAMEAALFRSVARLNTLSAIASAEVGRAGVFSPGAADALVKASRELLALAESDAFTAAPQATYAPGPTAHLTAEEKATRVLQLLALGSKPVPEMTDAELELVARGQLIEGESSRLPALAPPAPQSQPPRPRIRLRPIKTTSQPIQADGNLNSHVLPMPFSSDR